MTSKLNFISTIISSCFLVMMLVSCESHPQKSDDAFERVKEDKEMPKDDNNKGEEIIHVSKKAKSLNKNNAIQTKVITKSKINLFKNSIPVEKDSVVFENKMDQNRVDIKAKWEKLERR